MIKILLMMKRRPGMSFQEFVDYYETKHRLIGIRFNKGCRRYTRRYLTKLESDVYGPQPEPAFDVLTEMWYDDQKAMDKGLAQITAAEASKVIAEDSARLFDGHSFHMFVCKDERVDDNL
jgi:hypothetical protein